MCKMYNDFVSESILLDHIILDNRGALYSITAYIAVSLQHMHRLYQYVPILYAYYTLCYNNSYQQPLKYVTMTATDNTRKLIITLLLLLLSHHLLTSRYQVYVYKDEDTTRGGSQTICINARQFLTQLVRQ